VVYLFHAAASLVHLSLNDSYTAEFKENTRAVLQDRATLIGRRLYDFSNRLPVNSIDLGPQAQLPSDYTAGHAMGNSRASCQFSRLYWPSHRSPKIYQAHPSVSAPMIAATAITMDKIASLRMAISTRRKIERNSPGGRRAAIAARPRLVNESQQKLPHVFFVRRSDPIEG
jgi:hypothetical protein